MLPRGVRRITTARVIFRRGTALEKVTVLQRCSVLRKERGQGRKAIKFLAHRSSVSYPCTLSHAPRVVQYAHDALPVRDASCAISSGPQATRCWLPTSANVSFTYVALFQTFSSRMGHRSPLSNARNVHLLNSYRYQVFHALTILAMLWAVHAVDIAFGSTRAPRASSIAYSVADGGFALLRHLVPSSTRRVVLEGPMPR